ncbi:hypothetical protein [Roseibacillus persicicus]|uniref:hypothetical protein n=1 Tax=Roseibacillus persicicus TaxID=454148 RepID=UPI00280C872B|nr:hypothetical protein [Roseibacillus persicicus]MDQ8192356.1 hypothetical protein [Roseibacillus persicicus]
MKTINLKKLAIPLLVLISTLLTSCFEHDTPFTNQPSRQPEKALNGIWKDEKLLNYYSFQKIDQHHLRIIISKFSLNNPETITNQEVIEAFVHTLDGTNILVSQKISRGDGEIYDLKKWGYFPYEFVDDGEQLNLSVIGVETNAKTEAVRQALPNLKEKAPSIILRKTNLQRLPSRVPEHDEREHSLRAKEAKLKQLEKKLSEHEQQVKALQVEPNLKILNEECTFISWEKDGEEVKGVEISFNLKNNACKRAVKILAKLTCSEGEWEKKIEYTFKENETVAFSAKFDEPSDKVSEVEYQVTIRNL